MTRLIPRSLADFCVPVGTASPMTADLGAPTDAPTIVTAFFDTGRETWQTPGAAPSRYRRGTDFYLGAFNRLARLPNPMVIFTEPRFAATVLAARESAGLAAITRVFTLESLFDAPPATTLLAAVAARQTAQFRRFVWAPDLPEYNEPRYVAINALKSAFVLTAMHFGAVATADVAWLDFGYCRSDDQFDAAVPWRFDTMGCMNLFQVLVLDDTTILDVVRSGQVWFHGALAVGPTIAWPDYADALDAAFRALLACDLVDDDQTLVLMAWRAKPTDYRLNPVPHGQWLSTLRLYRTGSPRPVVTLPRAQIRNDIPPWWQELRIAWKRGHRRLKAQTRTALRLG